MPYGPWFAGHRATEEEQKGQRTRKFADPVTFSIAVPLYRTPERYLREMIASVQAQTYPHWELCLANGSRKRNSSESSWRSMRRKIRVFV